VVDIYFIHREYFRNVFKNNTTYLIALSYLVEDSRRNNKRVIGWMKCVW
jgi:hypothetical protein